MKKLIAIIPLLCIVVLKSVFAQSTAEYINVRGVVTDNNNEPMIGVTIALLNENKRVIGGTNTDFDGRYFIKVPKDGVIQFSFIGMKTQTLNVENKKIINIKLISKNEVIEEISIKGRNYKDNGLFKIAARDMSAATETFDMEKMNGVQVTSLEDAMSGQLANVNIVANSGDPGSNSAIRIRGTASLNGNNEPLIVVDGIPFDTKIGDDFDFATANQEDFGALVNISPNDIQSIEVLKDAAATAIWGERGSNGVLVITSKRGVRGKTNITFSSKFSAREEPNPIPVLDRNQYYALQQDAMWNYMKGFKSKFDYHKLEGEYQKLTNYLNPNFKYYDEFNSETNWLDLITQSSLIRDHSLSLRGGGDRARYYASASYVNDNGTTIGTSLDRFTTKINIDYKVSTKLTFSTDFNFSRSVKKAPYSDPSSNHKIPHPRGVAYIKNPGMSPYEYDINGNITDIYFTADDNAQNWQGDLHGVYNPLAAVNESFSNVESSRIRSTFRVRYNFAKGFTWQSDVSMDLNNHQTKKYLPQVVTGVPWNNNNANRATDATNESFNLYVYNRLNYFNVFEEKHELSFMAATTTRMSTSDSYTSTVWGLNSTQVTDPSSGGTITELKSGTGDSRSVSFLAAGHYKYNDKYIVDLNLRSSGNSSVGKKVRWNLYPSVGLSWRLSAEEFLKKDWLTDLRLRASWGRNGNLPFGSAYSTYAASGSYINMPIIRPENIQMDNLKPERITQTNLGISAELFDSRYIFTVDVYKKKTEDMFFKDVKLPGTTGFDKIKYLNMGSAQNYGWEFTSRVRVLRSKDWKAGFVINLSQNFNEILSYPSNFSNKSFELTNGEKSYAKTLRLGDPIGAFYGFIYDGVYSKEEDTYATDSNGNVIYSLSGEPVRMSTNNYVYQAGDAKYRDINKDGVIDKYDVVYLGNGMPDLMGGLGTDITYKNLTVRANFSFSVGQEIVNIARMNTENMGGRNNQSTAVLKRWRRPGDVTDTPRALYRVGYNYLGSDRFVENGSYLRLKSVSISYKLRDKAFLKSLGIKQLELFASGYDLWTLTGYKGQDPEVSIGGSWTNLIGADRSTTPRSKRYTFGFNVNF
ncbi:SusC/RagA family TonB-linked outer membrane protein [Prolixibacteraceae bacterium JC049]|nr:SusC/RagA family TonB-linked outer membrane protein [Prolixibacteraceae bacterium JC049]